MVLLQQAPLTGKPDGSQRVAAVAGASYGKAQAQSGFNSYG